MKLMPLYEAVKLKTYYDYETEYIFQEHPNGKVRIFNERTGRPWTRFQELKEDEEGMYVVLNGERIYTEPSYWEEEDLDYIVNKLK